MDIQRVALCLSYVILYLDVCLSQKDCTAVDCPVLQNCIKEVLEAGACCATCVRKGCTCEGYQYYDCIHAGFRQGKVPQGESYFVDFGSTECSCPHGGGKIGCHFIPCPEVPPNCIDVTAPEDGCPECGQIGCVHGNKKYKAGHRFQMDPCQMCYCPNHGGHLACSPIPGCDTHVIPSMENNDPLREIKRQPRNKQTNPPEKVSKLPLGDSLPLYKQDPPGFGTDKYDHTLIEATSSLPLDRNQTPESTASPSTQPEVDLVSSPSRGHMRREGQGGTPGSPDQERKYKVEAHHQLLRQNIEQIATGGRKEAMTLAAVVTATQRVTTENPRPKDTAPSAPPRDKEGEHGGHHRHTPSGNSSGHVAPHEAQGHEGPTGAHREEQPPYQTVRMSPTRRPPLLNAVRPCEAAMTDDSTQTTNAPPSRAPSSSQSARTTTTCDIFFRHHILVIPPQGKG
ncbi:hypothetical protein NHX12_013467 [Muraenolepis orangiensis]|uniref:Fibulin-2 domain-containing protein n=1 Tax=Muraenolepis orangiensis TaxID=630683 RepID=A0A9Q0DF02_9TELE|nr:hypothetical protein NHX12_013467 [Muraenolepis orangiensis]